MEKENLEYVSFHSILTVLSTLTVLMQMIHMMGEDGAPLIELITKWEDGGIARTIVLVVLANRLYWSRMVCI